MNQDYRTLYLFKNIGSFLFGMSTVVNLSGDNFKYNTSKNPSVADAKAIANDWGVIGQDIEEATTKFKKEVDKQLTFNF